jgi:hypothetical protein
MMINSKILSESLAKEYSSSSLDSLHSLKTHIIQMIITRKIINDFYYADAIGITSIH